MIELGESFIVEEGEELPTPETEGLTHFGRIKDENGSRDYIWFPKTNSWWHLVESYDRGADMEGVY